VQPRTYYGIPSGQIKKVRFLQSQGIEVYKGRINESGQEKGVDVKIAVDIVHLTYEKQFDTALIISQDRDFEPAIRLSKRIAESQNRRIEFESHYIIGQGKSSDRGIPGTIWKPIDKTTFDSCCDANDYRN